MASESKEAIKAFADGLFTEMGGGIPVDPTFICYKYGIQVYRGIQPDNNYGTIIRNGDETRMFINNSLHRYNKKYAIACGLGYYFLNFNEIPYSGTIDILKGRQDTCEEGTKEWIAKRFADELLMNEDMIREIWQSNSSIPYLAKQFDVSTVMIQKRLLDMGLIAARTINQEELKEAAASSKTKENKDKADLSEDKVKPEEKTTEIFDSIKIAESVKLFRGAELKPGTFSEQLEINKFNIEKFKIEQVIETWSCQQREDRGMRKEYGKWLLVFLGTQLFLMDAVLVFSLFKSNPINTEALPYWLSALVIEVIGLVTVVAQGLFKNTTSEFHSLISSIFVGDKKSDSTHTDSTSNGKTQ